MTSTTNPPRPRCGYRLVSGQARCSECGHKFSWFAASRRLRAISDHLLEFRTAAPAIATGGIAAALLAVIAAGHGAFDWPIRVIAGAISFQLVAIGIFAGIAYLMDLRRLFASGKRLNDRD